MIPQKSNNQIIAAQNYSPIRAKSFKVKTKSPDYAQYAATIRAYALAGMPFEHIANAGDHLGDIVERLDLDAPIQESWKNKIGEIAEDKEKIMADFKQAKIAILVTISFNSTYQYVRLSFKIIVSGYGESNPTH